MSEKCDVCGSTTGLPESFTKERRLFRKSERTWCPHCWQTRRISRNVWLFVFQFVMGLAGLLMVWQSDSVVGWVLLSCSLFQVFLGLAIVPHELGHAWMAEWMGWRVFRIYIGSGKPAWKVKFFGFDAEFRPILFNGLVLATPRTLRHYRSKMCAFALAGPMANLILAGFAFALLGGTVSKFEAVGKHFVPLQLFLVANLALVIISLAPWIPQTPQGRVPSDGMQVWRTMRAGQHMAEQGHAAWFMLEGATCREEGRYEEAGRWFENGLKAYPKNIQLLSWHGLGLLDLLRLGEARDCFISVMTRTTNESMAHQMMKNNVAYMNVLLGKDELLDEADRYSLEAMENLAWHPAIKGTRGAVLIALRRFDEAVPLLCDAIKGHDSPREKATTVCWLAIAEAKRGNMTTARKFFDEAHRLDSTNSLLERSERALAAR
jgi:tetratricopeptide (TPR) repeat protein